MRGWRQLQRRSVRSDRAGWDIEPRKLLFAEAESVDTAEGNMSNAAMRGVVALPWSETPSRTKGSRRKARPARPQSSASQAADASGAIGWYECPPPVQPRMQRRPAPSMPRRSVPSRLAASAVDAAPTSLPRSARHRTIPRINPMTFRRSISGARRPLSEDYRLRAALKSS